MPTPDDLALRQTVLAVCVLDDIDLAPADDGLVLPHPRLEIAWAEVRTAIAGADPRGDLARIRLATWLRSRTLVARQSVDALRAAARPVGLPVDHVLHPGSEWVRHRVHGGAIEMGFGFTAPSSDGDDVLVVPPGVLQAAGVDPSPWWPVAMHYLEAMGSVAAQATKHSGLLGRVGDCDVVTLLAAGTLRTAVCGADPTRMVAASVPMRSRGWLNPSRIDAAFTAAAAAATDTRSRGFVRPVLLTVDEVVIAPAGGRPAEIVLRDPGVARHGARDTDRR